MCVRELKKAWNENKSPKSWIGVDFCISSLSNILAMHTHTHKQTHAGGEKRRTKCILFRDRKNTNTNNHIFTNNEAINCWCVLTFVKILCVSFLNKINKKIRTHTKFSRKPIWWRIIMKKTTKRTHARTHAHAHSGSARDLPHNKAKLWTLLLVYVSKNVWFFPFFFFVWDDQATQ